LISTIKTFKDLHTDIVKMRSFPILNSIFEHYSHEIFEGANCKLNFSKLIFNMRDHFPFVSDQDLEALIPDIEERKKFTESEMLKFINVSCQTPVKITSYLIYFHKLFDSLHERTRLLLQNLQRMVRPLHCCQQRKKASEPQCFTLSLQ
jgi:hypothetical protein